jgi:hypothetical protein
MNQSEFLQVILHITELCSSTEYRNAMRLSRRERAGTLARASENSDEYAAIRLLIGTWDRIAMISDAFNEKQYEHFFRMHPVSLIYQTFEEAIKHIREDKRNDRYAADLEGLNWKYQKWFRDSRQYTSIGDEGIHGLFFC